MTDKTLVRIATAALFVLGAWPLLLCDVPPLEDLPAHLATAVVIRHPEAYPGFVFHGFLKTNATLFLWLHAFPESRLVLASKLFVALVVLAHAWAIPRLVLEIGGRARVVSATLLAAPLVHNWFVAMGMLDFALASALGFACVTLMARQLREPSRPRAVGLAALAVVVWYAHLFAFAFVLLLAVIELARRRGAAAWRAAVPLAPAIALAIGSAALDFARSGSALSHAVSWRPPWEMAYELWAKYAWSFSKLELASLATTVVLAVSFVRERKMEAPLLSATAGVVLLAFVFFVPHEAAGWGNVSIRALPFLYAAALVRAPASPPRALTAGLGACAIACSVGLGVDYARLSRDFAELSAGTPVVPKGADLMPMIFAPKGSSENTWALDHGWAMYVLAKRTSAPMLFAHLPGHPVGYRAPPPEDEHPLTIEREIADSASDPSAAEALARVASRHAWVLVWGKAPSGFSPSNHVEKLRHGRLVILGPP